MLHFTLPPVLTGAKRYRVPCQEAQTAYASLEKDLCSGRLNGHSRKLNAP